MDTLLHLLDHYDIDMFSECLNGIKLYTVRVWDQGETIVESTEQELAMAIAAADRSAAAIANYS